MLPCPLGAGAGANGTDSNPELTEGVGVRTEDALGESDNASAGGSDTVTERCGRGVWRVGEAAVRSGALLAVDPVDAGPAFGAERLGAGAGSADSAGVCVGRVTVPFRLKFSSSRGPTESDAGVLVVGGGISCAIVGAGANAISAAAAAMQKRKPAVIPIPLIAIESRSFQARAGA